jgi:putative transposase
LAAYQVRTRRPHLRAADRIFWVLLRRIWSRWADALIIVKPETVVRWHRKGFRLYWAWISRRRQRRGRPRITAELREIIRRMGTENSWGAPRIHGELLKLGFDVSTAVRLAIPAKAATATSGKTELADVSAQPQ